MDPYNNTPRHSEEAQASPRNREGQQTTEIKQEHATLGHANNITGDAVNSSVLPPTVRVSSDMAHVKTENMSGAPASDNAKAVIGLLTDSSEGPANSPDEPRRKQSAPPGYPAQPYSLRTHRGWVVKRGKTPKCDFCSQRSRGILHQCSKCPVLICQKCAFDGAWKGDTTHYINTNELNWEYSAAPVSKKPAGTRAASQPIRDRSTSLAPSIGGRRIGSDGNIANYAGSKRGAQPSGEISGDADEGEDDELLVPKRQRQAQSPARRVVSAPTRAHLGPAQLLDMPKPAPSHKDDSRKDVSTHRALIDRPHIPTSYYHTRRASLPSEPASPAVTYTAAASRPNVRAAAAKALHRMNPPPRHDSGRVDNTHQADKGEDPGKGHHKSSVPADAHRPSAQALSPHDTTTAPTIISGNVIKTEGTGPKRTKSSSKVSGTISEPRIPRPPPGPYRGPFSSRNREHQVLTLYHEIFGRKGRKPYRPSMLTISELPVRKKPEQQQPDMMDLDQPENLPPAQQNVPPIPSTTVDNSQQEPPKVNINEQYHARIRTIMLENGSLYSSTSSHPTTSTPTNPSFPPPPPGHASYAFHNLPRTNNSYVPTRRTTPPWHPLNELTPEEIRMMHDDHFLVECVRAAWEGGNRRVERVRRVGMEGFDLKVRLGKGKGKDGGGGDFAALKLLWEVAEVRMTKVTLRDAPQTRKWFGEELEKVFFEGGGDGGDDDGDGERMDVDEEGGGGGTADGEEQQVDVGDLGESFLRQERKELNGEGDSQVGKDEGSDEEEEGEYGETEEGDDMDEGEDDDADGDYDPDN